MAYNATPPPRSLSDDDRSYYASRWTELNAELSTWLSDFQDCAKFLNPWNFRYSLSDTNRGGRRASRIINDTGGEALDIQAAGMMAGITNPGRTWFELRAHDPDLNEQQPVREWLDSATSRLQRMYAGSNIYEAFHEGYLNLGQFGTHCQAVLEDDEDGVRAYVFPVGEYCLALSDRGLVDTVYRKFRLTVRQMQQRFGLEALSPDVQELIKNRKFDQSRDILHAIEPNQDCTPSALGPKGKRWCGVYLEMSGQGPKAGVQGLLKEEGFNEFPCQAPRWQAMSGNVYGAGPGLRCMGDLKGLQELEREKGKIVEKIAAPPMVGPTSMMNEAVNLRPGGMNYVDNISAGQLFRPAMEINPQAIPAVEGAIRNHESRIQRKFHSDLWLAMQRGEGDPQKTAREIAELHEEKMMQLGPVMQRLDREYLGPIVNRGLSVCIRKGLLPPPPRELIKNGKLEYNVEYLSIVAQALKLIENGGMQSVSAFVGNFVAVKPDVLDVLNLDAMVRTFAANTGMKASLLNDVDTVNNIRQQKAQAAQQEQQAEMASKMAAGAKTLSETNMDGNNGLTALLGNSGLPGAALGGLQ